jgi:hypothetical protein
MLLTGITSNPLQDLTDLECVDAPWINRLRNFLRSTDIQITIPNLCGPKPLRTNDQSIMYAAVRNKFSTQQVRLINKCLLWLQVTTLAEITDIDGSDILPHALRGTAGSRDKPKLWSISRSNLTWSHTCHPNTKAWKAWQRELLCLTTGYTTRLHKPLGNLNNHWNTQRTW